MGGGGVGTALRIGTRARSVTNIGGSVTNIKECNQHRVEKVEILHQRHIRRSRATRGIRVSGVESERSEEARHVRRRGAQRWRERGGDDGDG